MTGGHQVTRGFPAPNIAGGNSPSRAGKLALAGQKLLIDRRPKNRKSLSPLLNFCELFARHRPGQEKIFRVFAQSLSHILLRRVVIITGTDRMPVHFHRRKELEHLLDFLDVRLLVNGGVGRNLEAEKFCHSNGGDTFSEHTFALHNQIMGVFQAGHHLLSDYFCHRRDARRESPPPPWP